MNTHPEPGDWLPPEPTEEQIREHAYHLWLNDGQVHGRDLEHWLTARQQLLRRARDRHAGSTPPAEKFGSARHIRANQHSQHVRVENHRAEIATSGAEQRVRARHQVHHHELPAAPALTASGQNR